jgi:hypothetical protein
MTIDRGLTLFPLVGLMRTNMGPQDRPWFCTITALFAQSPYDRGYEATREEAMAAFKTRWMQMP